MIRGKWLTAQIWDRYINNNHPLSDYSLVDAVMKHHAVSYDQTLRHLDLNGKVNDEGVYNHFLTGNNMSTLHCYQVSKKGEARNDHKVNTGCFWYKRLYNPFTQGFGCTCYTKKLGVTRILQLSQRNVKLPLLR